MSFNTISLRTFLELMYSDEKIIVARQTTEGLSFVYVGLVGNFIDGLRNGGLNHSVVLNIRFSNHEDRVVQRYFEEANVKVIIIIG